MTGIVLLVAMGIIWFALARVLGSDAPAAPIGAPSGPGEVSTAAASPAPSTLPAQAGTAPEGREPWSPLSAVQILGVSPSQGSTVGGEAVVVSGAGFVDGTVVVFGTRSAPEVEVLNSQTLRVLLPPGLPGPVPIEISAPGEVAARAEGLFTYAEQQPRVIMAIRPSLGTTAGGSAVTIVGTGFLPGARVMIGGQRASEVEVLDSTRITALAPAHDEGLVDVVVRNPALPASILRAAFEYVPGPTIAEVLPGELSASGGEPITILGTGFERGIEVTVNGLPATGVRVLSEEELTAVAPAGVLGPAAVAVTIPGQPVAELRDAVVFVPAPVPMALPEPVPTPAPVPAGGPGDGAPAADVPATPAG